MVNPRSPFSEKSRWRQSIREQLQTISPSERQWRSLRICKQFHSHFSGKKVLALFAPTPTEPNLDLLWDLDLPASHLVSYPRCEGGTLLFRPVSALSELALGRFGIREPGAGPAVTQLDLILVPGLAFTADGSRLGRGAGFYDRFLSAIPATTVKIGVCFEFQRVSEIPQESHDVKMDAVVCG
jgi:5-formyltetrahydrofolate cyclo-ligase